MKSEAGDEGRSQENWIETVRGQVRSIRFGQVQIVVHEGRVVQIERTEKLRFDSRPEADR